MTLDPTAGPADPIVDRLGLPYLAETIDLEPDDEGAVVATLVKRAADPDPAQGAAQETSTVSRAVLHIHGFSDYFFQKEHAEWWAQRGYDFYALDLRKYGRSLLPHQTPNYVADLGTYYEEIDAAWERITVRDEHTEVIVTAHSTGGLTMPLWAHDRRPKQLIGMVLNSPWFDLQGSPLLRVVGTPVIKQLGGRYPRFHIRRHVSGIYARSLHRDHEGEWDFELDLKPLTSFPVYAGWLKAIRDGHARLHEGLDVQAPVLVLSSDQSHWTVHMSDEAHNSDLVLDVQQIRRWATAVGNDVTYKAVTGARHDVLLSLPNVRQGAYDLIRRWSTTWID